MAQAVESHEPAYPPDVRLLYCTLGSRRVTSSARSVGPNIAVARHPGGVSEWDCIDRDDGDRNTRRYNRPGR